MAARKGKKRNSKFKIVVLGNSGVGKSCLLTRYTKNLYDVECASTMGIDQFRKKEMFKNTEYDLEIFDTAGQERFRTITTAYYKSSKAFLMVYDIGDADSFKDIHAWIKQIELYSNHKHVRVLIGNKLDNEAARQVARADAEAFAKTNQCVFFEVSAKTGENVQETFAGVLQKLVNLKRDKKRERNAKAAAVDNKGDEDGCCRLS